MPEPDEQKALRTQREVKDRQHARLRLGLQVDQKIAAGNEIDAGERRVGEHVMHGEDDERAQLGRDAITIAFAQEMPGEALR